MLLKIDHQTRYEYTAPVTFALQQLRTRPLSSRCQTVIDWKISLKGAKLQTSFVDQHGNHVDLVELESGTEEIVISVSGEVETIETNGVLGRHTLAMPLWFYLRQSELTKPGPQIDKLIESLDAPDRRDVLTLHALSAMILERVAYKTGQTGIQTTAEAALEHAAGVCQDHTHIFLSAARELGFPARYVSGYLMMDDRIEQEASHAWAEAHIDGLGWVGFDVSNSISPDERYVHVARGTDYRDAAPTTGFLVGAQGENLVVSLQVQQ
ncbi:MAG: transglutaminase family protein [Pseudomonadota bacterium]